MYALGDERVLRVLRPGGSTTDVRRRARLVTALARARPPYLLPEVLDVGEVEGRAYAIERRLPGRSLIDVLGTADGPPRDRLVEAYLGAAWSLGDLPLPLHDGFGDLVADDPIVASTWRAYAEARAARNLSRSTPELRGVDSSRLAADLADTAVASFVHLDAFPGNMLTDGVRITAVLDVGATSLAGDRRLDPLASAVYLSDRNVTPTATSRDVDVAAAWLRAHGLAELLAPARRWLAAYWSFEVHDAALIEWCTGVLLDPERTT